MSGKVYNVTKAGRKAGFLDRLEPVAGVLRRTGNTGKGRIGMRRMALLGLGLWMQAGAAGNLELGVPAGAPVDGRGLAGTVLPIWGNADKYQRLAEGIRRGGFSLLRFPNGTLSNEYHWNGMGEWDSSGIWHSRDSAYAPGFLADVLHRGTTRDNYGATFPSQVLDGDTSTFWWGRGSAQAPSWFVVDFRNGRRPDSLEIVWGDLRPRRVRIESFLGSDDHGQGPHTSMEGRWTLAGEAAVKAGVTTLRLKGDSTRYLALRFEGVAERGVQLREVRAWERGNPASRNTGVVKQQTRGIALGTLPASERKRAWQPRDWDFETFMASLRREWPGARPLICTNLGTGTAQEAAAWVHYANKVKGYGIRHWQVGNESNGDWEDGGPLDAAQMAERFLEFSRAMKAVDSTIEVLGPVYASMDVRWCGSGKGDGTTWMGEFLRIVGEAERRDGKRYLDGVDFHAYPYWWNDGETPNPQAMLAAADRLGGHLDTLLALIGRNLSDPGSRRLSMSEYNASVKVTHYTLTHHDGTLVALMLAHLASRAGDRSLANLWEISGGEPMNPDGTSTGTYGSLRVFTPPRRGAVSDLGDAPTGAFWGQFLSNLWTGSPADSLRPLSATLTGSPSLRAFALGSGKGRSILVANLGEAPDTLRLAGEQASGELLTWGASQYAWDGTTSQARAFPNAGPDSRPWKAGEAVVVPAYGVAVLRTGFSGKPGPVRRLHRVATGTVLRENDTLGLSLSVAQEHGRLSKARWSLDGGAWKPLPALDGAWDGSHETALLTLPASALGLGGHRLRLEIEGEKGRILSDTVEVEVTRPPRTVERLETFDAPESPWYPYVHKTFGGSYLRLTTEPQIDTAQGNARYLSFDFAIGQPGDLGYPNFVTAGSELDLKRLAGKKPAGIVFDYAAQYETGGGLFSLYLLSDLVKDYDHHRVLLEPTGGRWKRDTVWFAGFAQEGWGKPLGPLQVGTVTSVQLRAQGAGSGTLKFDNFCLIGTEGEAVRLPPVPVSPRRRGR